MLLPNFDSYSDLDEILKLSPAATRYARLCESPPTQLNFLDSLRLKRHNFWLNAAVATLSRNFNSEEVCEYWSDSTETIVQMAWTESGCANLNLCLIALGKWGARELNLSSDIDIIVVSAASPTEQDFSAFKKFVTCLTQKTEYGFCLRVDNDLRPGGRFGPMISSLDQINDYYWNQGATWERIALIRARIVFGPQSLANEIREIFAKFIFRKYLDFTLINDIKLLRNRISEPLKENASQFNLKLTRGGIRDIEFFVNSLQVIHGGRNPILRTESTKDAIKQLEIIKAFPKNELQFLISFYWKLRDLENITQALNDQQTHIWNHNTMISNIPSSKEILEDLNKSLNIVSSLIKSDAQIDQMPSPENQKQWLMDLGFSELSIANVWQNILEKTAFSSKGEAAEHARLSLLYNFAIELGSQPLGKDRGLSLLLDFLTNARAKTTFFTTLNRDPRIISDLARLFCSAPYLGLVIASRPELIDGFVLQLNEIRRDRIDHLIEDLGEQKLLTEISAAKDFLLSQKVPPLVDKLSQLADQVCTELLAAIKKEFPSDIEIVALGKWGSRELGFRSDLDFIFVCPDEIKENDHRAAKRLISYLTSSSKGGPIYSVDFRLRPSGASGPLIVNRKSLVKYLSDSAQAWERQSYLRARAIGAEFADFKKLCIEKSLSNEDISELRNIRTKLLTGDFERTGNIDIKKSPGGLLDIELASQTICLYFQHKISDGSTIPVLNKVSEIRPQSTDSIKELIGIHNFLRTLEQNLQLKSSYSTSELKVNSETFELLCLQMKMTKDDLIEITRAKLRLSHEIIKSLDPIYLQS